MMKHLNANTAAYHPETFRSHLEVRKKVRKKKVDKLSKSPISQLAKRLKVRVK